MYVCWFGFGILVEVMSGFVVVIGEFDGLLILLLFGFVDLIVVLVIVFVVNLVFIVWVGIGVG